MLELFFALYLQAAVLLSGGTTTTTTNQSVSSQTTISQPGTPVTSSTKLDGTTKIGGGGWDDKN